MKGMSGAVFPYLPLAQPFIKPMYQFGDFMIQLSYSVLFQFSCSYHELDMVSNLDT